MSPSVNTRENRAFASELKFVVPRDVAVAIRGWARQNLQADPHANGADGDFYEITSLYFDSPEFDVFHRRGSYGRSKYRVRRYGTGAVVFLERKLKTRGLVSKRRTTVPMEEVSWLQTGGEPGSWRGGWFQRRLELRRLNPVCQIAYDRTARVASTMNGPVRLTVDENLRGTLIDSAAFVGDRGKRLSEGFAILEMKFLVTLPVCFKNLIEDFRIEPRAFSKYRWAMSKLGVVPAPEPVQAAEPALEVYA